MNQTRAKLTYLRSDANPRVLKTQLEVHTRDRCSGAGITCCLLNVQRSTGRHETQGVVHQRYNGSAPVALVTVLVNMTPVYDEQETNNN